MAAITANAATAPMIQVVKLDGQMVDARGGTAMRPGQFTCMDDRAPGEQTLRRQLTAFAQFTTSSLGERNINSLLMDACLRSRAGLNVTHAKLMEYLPDRDRLLLHAGVGWKEGYVGQYQVPPDIDTPIGHAFALSEPVAISDYISERTIAIPISSRIMVASPASMSRYAQTTETSGCSKSTTYRRALFRLMTSIS